MAKEREAAAKALREWIARVGVTGAMARGPKAQLHPPKHIRDCDALIPDALAIRVANDFVTDADLFREVAACVLHHARLFADSSKKDATDSIKHARERAKKARELVNFAMGAEDLPSAPIAARWAVLVEAAIHAGSAFSLSVEHFSVRRPQSRTARRRSQAIGNSTREKVQAEVAKMNRKVSKPQAAVRISAQLGMSDKYIYGLLCKMYPDPLWNNRHIS
jgi:hypothetical protein